MDKSSRSYKFQKPKFRIEWTHYTMFNEDGVSHGFGYIKHVESGYIYASFTPWSWWLIGELPPEHSARAKRLFGLRVDAGDNGFIVDPPAEYWEPMPRNFRPVTLDDPT